MPPANRFAIKDIQLKPGDLLGQFVPQCIEFLTHFKVILHIYHCYTLL
ncbi:hypothetical protein MMC2321_01976 [Chitinophaga sp. MM2321]